jgi:hypothetical protein
VNSIGSRPTRDNFPESVKQILADRVGNRCSNPDCLAITSGPQVDPGKALNVGVGAHITAAASGGPRYDPNLSPEERSGPTNGIWLCQTCGKLVDNDEARFTADTLRDWKSRAESDALAKIGKARIESQPCLPTAAEIAEELRKHSQQDSTLRADLEYLFFGRDALYFNYINHSKDTAQQPKYWFGGLDLSRPYFPPGSKQPNGLPILTQVQASDFCRPGDMQGKVEVLNTQMARSHVQRGDKLWLAAWITCANCAKTRAYYVYFEVGKGGWYAQAPDSTKMELPKPLDRPVSDAEIEAYADELVPISSRITIPQTLP